jgi:4-carboxymuconolactone decarboxylase
VRRIPAFTPDELDPQQRRLYDRILGGPRAGASDAFPLVDTGGGLQGPLNAWLLNTELGGAFDVVGAAIRFGLTLSPRPRELVIFAVAHHYRCPFELYAHRRIGAAAGLSQDEIEQLSRGETPPLESDADRTALATAKSLLAGGDLSDDEYARAVAAFGEGGLFEILSLVGWYTLLALQLNVFRVPPADEAQGIG